ncbi:MAG: sensor domain-containing diguanylate cyclase [Lachnospiraceae bacterium]|nr:sensor domain-containing diguanylate cyclase [Lachnospiraceae bacterium]
MTKNNKEQISKSSVILAVIAVAIIFIVLGNYTHFQKKNVINNAEQITNQVAEYIASNISGEIGYAESSVKLAAVTIAQTMTSDTLENPSEVIGPMVANTPFGGIEYIRADGMNVMNIGEPFDASDRVYYIEGIKGNTGVWNNYHPKTSKETLVNFYTPLIYDGKNSGVITGYIEATRQLSPLFETTLFGQPIHGLLVDENNMVICSTIESEFVKDLTLDMFMEQFDATEDEIARTKELLAQATETAVSYKDMNGEGRICIAAIPGTQWKVAIIVPAASFEGFVSENTKSSVFTIVSISLIIVLYATYVLLRNAKRRRDIASEKAKLQSENVDIHDIIASANMGTWHIELVDGKEPRMFADDTMKSLLGISGQEYTPEETYTEWFSKISPEAVPSVLNSVEQMKMGNFDENTYLWNHPTKGTRFVRCGGTAQEIPGGHILRGYHYDVDDVVREDQAKVVMLMDALNEKNEYYSTLGTLEGIFYSMHVIDILDDTVVEFNSRGQVKEMFDSSEGAVKMMSEVIGAVVVDEYRDDALEFTDLTTLSDRMKDKKIISKQFVGKHTGWFLASFITMENDKEGNPTKVIFTTRVIDDEKRQEEKLIKKTQTDELTGLFNRRAYEEDIYAYNDTPEEDDFIYISLDVNGLKIVNDSKGHMAGDELIIGACQCMKKSLSPYGKLYRIGGDEFVAIIHCNTKKVEEVLADFDDTIISWSGKLVESLSISYGWISKEEEPEFSVRQLGAVAEQRMYEAKADHYKQVGVDRRGQKDAHKALCELYTKILKINITDDSYQIVDMDVSEQTSEKGFAESISSWLKSFGESGQVHPDDLNEYLKYTDLDYMRNYFMGNKTSLHIFYRRKFGDEFKQVMMEIIPANDYSKDNQNFFLYVKNIEK